MLTAHRETSVPHLFGLETQLFVERLTLWRGVQLYAFDFQIRGARSRAACISRLRKPAAPVFRPGQHHSNPGQSASIAEQGGGRDDLIIEFDSRNNLADRAAAASPSRR